MKKNKEITGPVHYDNNLKEVKSHEEAQKELNSQILKITLRIKEQFPELSIFLEEMSVTIPDEEHPEITLKNLRAYYDSLKTVLDKYILEHQ